MKANFPKPHTLSSTCSSCNKEGYISKDYPLGRPNDVSPCSEEVYVVKECLLPLVYKNYSGAAMELVHPPLDFFSGSGRFLCHPLFR